MPAQLEKLAGRAPYENSDRCLTPSATWDCQARMSPRLHLRRRCRLIGRPRGPHLDSWVVPRFNGQPIPRLYMCVLVAHAGFISSWRDQQAAACATSSEDRQWGPLIDCRLRYAWRGRPSIGQEGVTHAARFHRRGTLFSSPAFFLKKEGHYDVS